MMLVSTDPVMVSSQDRQLVRLADKPGLTSAEWLLIYSDHFWSFCLKCRINFSNEKGCGTSELVT